MRLHGVKSARSYGAFLRRCGTAENGLLVPRISVCPSGADLATSAAAIAPSAPGLFSTSTGWTSAWPSGCAMMRITMSVEEPAPKGTSTRTGFAGNCATAALAVNSSAIAANSALTSCAKIVAIKQGDAMQRQSTQLRALLRAKTFLHLPSVYDALGGRLVQSLGYEATYAGGYVSGASSAVTEPLLTMTEQLKLAGDIAQSIDIPLIVDGGAGFGDALHTMRTVRECVRAGIAGAHIEDQLYPKRAHYHKYVVHGIPVDEYVDKIKYACKQRDESDADFVAARQEIEDLIDLSKHYEIEAETVEKRP